MTRRAVNPVLESARAVAQYSEHVKLDHEGCKAAAVKVRGFRNPHRREAGFRACKRPTDAGSHSLAPLSHHSDTLYRRLVGEGPSAPDTVSPLAKLNRQLHLSAVSAQLFILV